MTILEKVNTKFKIVAYDPMKPPKEGPITVEIWTATSGQFPDMDKKVGELKLTKEEAKHFYDGGDKDKEKILKQHKLMNPKAEFNGSGDGDTHSMFLGVSGDDEIDGLFMNVKNGHEDVLDAMLEEDTSMMTTSAFQYQTNKKYEVRCGPVIDIRTGKSFNPKKPPPALPNKNKR
jgi:hypothetical protein